MITSLPLPSNRSFGTLFVVVFALVGGFIWWRGGGSFGWWFGVSALTLLVTLLAPDWLTPANRAWMKLAELLNRIVSPLVLGVMFFGMFAPMGWAMRLSGRDALKRRIEPEARSYWVERTPPGPDAAGLPNQF
jgi:Saxitoxin biosynthesis operon protein SxtJ